MKVYYDKDADLSLIKGKNVTIIGYNQAVGIINGGNIRFQDTNLLAEISGQADNTPLFVNGGLWIYMNGGTLEFYNSPSSAAKLTDARSIIRR